MLLGQQIRLDHHVGLLLSVATIGPAIAGVHLLHQVQVFKLQHLAVVAATTAKVHLERRCLGQV